ncbi:GRP family sugar transporter [Microbacter margulisiae]|uniref:Glucose uptake protein n=1 Tax=Microbacter margulisiae TaxID=1350067 RepID=A0A7W5DTR6_9PORP|nr:GRP family sugar transporter [Microbacter margulisiae]MBB3188761.1 glucose uptake protein [Microbacter margulisiae]
MTLIQHYIPAVLFLIFSMICWGSWANTQKMAAKAWRFELFYFDFVWGLLLTAIVAAFTLGSFGPDGRSFLEDIHQADTASIAYAFAGGVVWNLGTFLLVAAMAIAGMSVGFPIGGGLAWVLGIIVNFFIAGSQGNNIVLLFLGVAFIVAAIIFCMFAYKKLATGQKGTTSKGIIVSLLAGVTIAFFYGLVVKSLDPAYVSGGSGNLTPFTGVFFFTIGAVISTPFFNLFVMKHPVHGDVVSYKEYFKGDLKTHFTGVLGGIIWMSGMVISFMSVPKAGPTISYALTNGAPVVAMFWGVFVWKEFRTAPRGTNKLLTAMFALFILGLVLITFSKA